MSSSQLLTKKRLRAFSPHTGERLASAKQQKLEGQSSPGGRKDALELLSGAWKDKENMSIQMMNAPTTPSTPHDELKGMVVEVEGNIGSGKSTLSKMLVKMLNEKTNQPRFSDVFAETVNNTFLGAFYSDLKRFAFSFQMYMLTTRLYQMQESCRQAREEDRLVFLDRGAVGDTLFALLNYQSGNIDNKEMDIYKSVCSERLPKSISDQVDVVLYLDVDPAECHRRVTTVRNNEAEDGIPKEYLVSVDDCYFHLLMDWMGKRRGGFHEMNIGAPPPLVVFQWDEYGKSEDIVEALKRIKRGDRRDPQVTFQVEQNEPFNSQDAHVVLDTEEQLNAAYKLMKETGFPCVSPSLVNNPSATLSINWDLEHTNQFKRVVMFFLAQCGNVIYYGPTTVVTSNTPFSPSRSSAKSKAKPSPASSPLSESSNNGSDEE